MFLSLLRSIVEFTPTQEDDEFLAKVDAFLDKNPELAMMAFKLIMSFLRAKQSD